MLLFWIFGSIMIVAALLLVVPPLMQAREDSGGSTADANVSLYRDRLADLDRSLDKREIDPDRYAALREDLERGLLADVGGPTAPRVGARPPPYWMAVAVAVLVPVGSLAFYLAVGSPHRLDAQSPASDTAAAAEQTASDTVAAAQQTASVEAMVDALAAKLARDPADGEGWLLLARSQVVLERFDEAIAGFERARGLLGDTPDLLVDWAEAEAGLAGNRFTANALDRLERALAMDPDHEKALWLGGFAAAQSGRMDTAIERWERLRDRQEPGSREASIIAEMLARIRGETVAPPTARSGSAGAAEPSAPGGGARIVVAVRLAPDLAVELGASEPVFIFARAPSGGGPPFAVARTIVGALPTTIVLDESNAMIPSRTLASVERVTVAARVARSGTANRTSGDVEGVVGPVAVADTAPVEVVISQVVP